LVSLDEVEAVAVGYDEVWKVLADFLIELQERGESIPNEIMEDLRSAKTMIQILKANHLRTENLARIEMYLENVESYLVFAAQDKLGVGYAENWMRKIMEARTKVIEEEKVPSRFFPGMPRGKHWVRIQISNDTPRNEIESLASETGLSCRMQQNGYVLVYGEDEKIKSFVRKIAEKFRGLKKK
jgi:hypothetical protein